MKTTITANILNEIVQYRQREFEMGRTPREIPLTPEQQSRLEQWIEQTKTVTVAPDGAVRVSKPIDLSGGVVFGMRIVPTT